MRAAYVDESIHDDHGLYCVGIVTVAVELRPAVVKDLSAIVPGSARPHWHDESPEVRLKLATAVGRLDIEAHVCACRFDRPRRKESARSWALRHLVGGIGPDVAQLVLDSRDVRQNATDRQVLRSASKARRGFRYGHESSWKEPLLWLADVVVGAVACDLVGQTPTYREQLDDVLLRVDCQA